MTATPDPRTTPETAEEAREATVKAAVSRLFESSRDNYGQWRLLPGYEPDDVLAAVLSAAVREGERERLAEKIEAALAGLMRRDNYGHWTADQGHDLSDIASIVAASLAAPEGTGEKPTEEARVWTDAEMTQALRERDEAVQWADELADTIARAARVEIGEHTSGNNPWANALHESNRLIRDGGWVS